MTAHEAVLPSVVKYFPAFPVWLGKASTVPHSTPVPVDFRYCPLVPLDAEAVRVPDSVALSRVTAAIVETVVPEVIRVVPIVGARYPAGAAVQAIPLVAVLEAVRT
jgi:hypothetical protein